MTLPGTAIFLNGSSSAGKTTLAHALQREIDEPYLHIALDQFRDGLPDKFRGLNSPAGTSGAAGLNVVPATSSAGDRTTRIVFGETGERMLKGMRRAMATMLLSGNNIIIDDIILDPDFLTDYVQVFAEFSLYFIGVRCDEATLEARETQRPGRFPGTARGHLAVCHAHRIYDAEVDTSSQTPEECASVVTARMKAGPPGAFEAILQRSSSGD